MLLTTAPTWRLGALAHSRGFWKIPLWSKAREAPRGGDGRLLRGRDLIRAVGTGFSKSRPRSRPGFTQRVFYNHIAFSYLAQLCPDYFTTFEGTMSDICNGSQIALKYLSEKVTDDDLNALNQRVEDSLYESLSEAVTKYRPVWEVEWPGVEAQLDQLIIIMGATRGGTIRPGQIFTIGGQQLVMRTEEAAQMNLSNPRKWSKAAGLLRSGGLVNADVRIKCRQKFWIPDEEEKPTKFEPTTHIFRIEMDLIPHSEAMSEYRPTSSMNRDMSCGVSYEPTQWKIIDVNDAYGGNPPMRFDNLSPEMDEEHWKGDTFHTEFVASLMPNDAVQPAEVDVEANWRSKSTLGTARKPTIIPRCNPCHPGACIRSGPQWVFNDDRGEEWYKDNIRKFIWEFSPDAADPSDGELSSLLECMKQGRACQFSKTMLKITQNTIEKRVAERAKRGDPKADYFKVYAIHERFDRYGLQMPKSDASHPQMSLGDKTVQRLRRNLTFGRMLLKKPHVATFSGELMFQRKTLVYGENEKAPDYVGIRSAEELRGQVESITATSNGANFQFLDAQFREKVVERIASIDWDKTVIDLYMPVPFPDGTVYRPAMNSVWVVRKSEDEELLFYVLHSASAAGCSKAKFLGINWGEKTVGKAGQKFTSLSNAENVYSMSATQKPLTLTLESYYFNRCGEGDKPYVTITCIFDPCTKKTYDEEYGCYDGQLALLEMSLLKGALMFALTENYFPDQRTAAIFRQVNISERKGLMQDLQDEILGATVNLFGDYHNFHGACWVVPPQLLDVKNSAKETAVQKAKEKVEAAAKEKRLKHREQLEALHRDIEKA